MMGVTFAQPYFLLLLLAVPLVGGVLLWRAAWRRRAVERLVGRQAATRASAAARVVKAAMLLTGLALLAVAAARPQIGSRTVLLPREGADVIIALDVSASMLAQDVEPNRFERAKTIISGVLDGLQGDRVGLIVFAGSANLRFPLTTDIDAARELVKGTVIREGNLRPGTTISEPLKIASGSFREDGEAQKAIVLISDGEDLGEGAVEAVRGVRDADIRLYTVALGTDQGSTLPVPDPRTGRVQTRTDPGGQPSISRANESLLRAVATAGRGKFFNGNGNDAAGEIAQEIAALQRARFETQEGSLPIERYQWFLAAGLALIAIETLIPERRRRKKAPASVTQGRQAA